MTKVKICGITNIDDALHAADCGADALGFVFFDKSPRCVSPEQARGIIAELPPFVAAVGLFVNEQPQRILEIAESCAIDVLQLHGDETPQDCLLSPHRVVKALRIKDESSLAPLGDYAVSALLLDAWVAGAYGGTGHVSNWELAAKAAETHRIILAGGLNPDNVSKAVRAVRPYGVDVSSGVEDSPGRKNHEKVEAFIRAAKNP